MAVVVRVSAGSFPNLRVIGSLRKIADDVRRRRLIWKSQSIV